MTNLLEHPDGTRHSCSVFAGPGALICTGELSTKRQFSSSKCYRQVEGGTDRTGQL